MHLRTSLVCLGLLATALACSDKGSGDGDDDTGGSSSGGSSSKAGSSSTAGTSSAGKTNGGSDTGGSGNSGAGAPSEGGAETAGPALVYSFDTATEGFVVSDSSAAMDVDPVPKADVMISHNADEGEPDPGSLQLDIPYSAASQYVSAGVDIRPPSMRAETDPGPDLSGKVITAWVMIQDGYGDAEELMTAPGNAKIYAKSGAAYVYASASVANLTTIGVWLKLTFEVDFPGYEAEAGAFDATDIREIGIQFDTNAMSTTFAPAVVLVDSISY